MSGKHLLPGQGLMFNTDKRSDSFPDFKGHVRLPSGEVLEIAGWFKTTKRIDTNYLSLKLTSTSANDSATNQDIRPDTEGHEG